MKRLCTPQRFLTTGLLAAVLATVAGAAWRPDPTALAREILADRSLREVHEMARKVFEDDLTAGSGYGEVWIRDLNTFIEVALEVNEPQRFRESLLTFFKFQGANGDIADAYIPRESAKGYYEYRSSGLAPTVVAHKNTAETDQESSLVQAVRKYISVTGDRAVLDEAIAGRSVRERLAQALDYVLTERFDPTHGLVWGATTADWGDVQPERLWSVDLDASSHRAIGIYDNAMFAIAVEDYLQLVGEHAPDSARWRSVEEDLARNVRKYLWDAQKQKFVPHLYLAGSPFGGDFDESAIYYHGGTAVAIEAGFLTRKETAGALEHMRADVRAAGAGSIGLTLFPAYPKGAFKTPGMDPYGYQNGGDWPWFGGRMIQQLIRQGFVADAYRELKPMVTRAQRAGDFYEWWSLDNQPRGSGQFRGSAGVLGRAIEMLQAWAEENKGHDTALF